MTYHDKNDRQFWKYYAPMQGQWLILSIAVLGLELGRG